jgi:hypothetical protein
VREISQREEALGQFEEEHLMAVVVEGKRYRTSAATLLASGPAWDERLGQEPRRRLDVRVGGLDLSAIVGGRGWERLGRQASLFRTLKGNYFVQFQSTWPGERDRLLPLSQDEAMRKREARSAAADAFSVAWGRRGDRIRVKRFGHDRPPMNSTGAARQGARARVGARRGVMRRGS